MGKHKKQSKGVVITSPTNVTHLIGVNANLDWECENPELMFKLEEKLGEGSFGVVHKGLYGGYTFAIKLVELEEGTDVLTNEINILKDCCHANVVNYFGAFKTSTTLWILMDYCGLGSVQDVLHITCTLHEKEIAAICLGALKGLQHLHARRVVHKDIKAANILLTEAGDIKLADFGVSHNLHSTLRLGRVEGSPYWMAPEIGDESRFNSKADIWSLGITAIEMAQGLPPYSESSIRKAMHMIKQKAPPKLDHPNKWSAEFNDFVARCLIKDPNLRPSADKLLNHPFILGAKKGALSGLCEQVLRKKKKMARKKGHKDKLALKSYGERKTVCIVDENREDDRNNTFMVLNSPMSTTTSPTKTAACETGVQTDFPDMASIFTQMREKQRNKKRQLYKRSESEKFAIGGTSYHSTAMETESKNTPNAEDLGVSDSELLTFRKNHRSPSPSAPSHLKPPKQQELHYWTLLEKLKQLLWQLHEVEISTPESQQRQLDSIISLVQQFPTNLPPTLSSCSFAAVDTSPHYQQNQRKTLTVDTSDSRPVQAILSSLVARPFLSRPLPFSSYINPTSTSRTTSPTTMAVSMAISSAVSLSCNLQASYLATIRFPPSPPVTPISSNIPPAPITLLQTRSQSTTLMC